MRRDDERPADRIEQQSRLIAALLSAALRSPLPARQAQSVEEFYRKTPVQLLIGFPVANAYDTYGRAVARHLGKHIPGNPTVIPVNRPGAGSLTVANFLYNAAPKDGATIAHFNRSVPLEPLMGNAAAKFDGRKFTWLGSVGNEVSVCVGWHTAAVKNWSDLLTKEFVAGAAGFGADTGIFPPVLKNLFGAKIKIITGYPGGGEMNRSRWSAARSTAAAAGHGAASRAGSRNGSAASRSTCWCSSALQKSRRAARRPADHRSGHHRRAAPILKLVFSRQEFAWPFAAPPDIPADRAQALRDAFAATLKDPEFLADAKKIQIDVNPISGGGGREADRRALCGAGA